MPNGTPLSAIDYYTKAVAANGGRSAGHCALSEVATCSPWTMSPSEEGLRMSRSGMAKALKNELPCAGSHRLMTKPAEIKR